MFTGSRQKLNSLSALPALEINAAQLNNVNFTKSLRVLIDENLTWSNHINAITKKVSCGIGSIKRISRCVPPATLHTIYHGLVQSQLITVVLFGVTVPKHYLTNYRDFKIELPASLLILVMMLTPTNYFEN